MTEDIFVVAHEGDADSAPVLDYAIERAKRDNARLVITHILEWSPYRFLTPTEIEERQARRKQEMSRAQEIILDPAVAKAEAAGVQAEGKMAYGNVPELIAKTADQAGASMIMVGRSGAGIGNRVFGSVTIVLAEISKVPVLIIP